MDSAPSMIETLSSESVRSIFKMAHIEGTKDEHAYPSGLREPNRTRSASW
jgi:hypothetical protein